MTQPAVSSTYPRKKTRQIHVGKVAVGGDAVGADHDEVDAAVSGLLALLEPVMIVFLGVVVGGMIVAMYLPIFDMVNAVG